MNIQSRLDEVGSQSRFQVYANIFSAMIWIMTSFNTFLPSYLLITPTFLCNGISNIKEIDACPIISTCNVEQQNTITLKAALYCDQMYIRNSILSVQFAGCIAGFLFIPRLSDRFGRKAAIITTLAIDLIGSTSNLF